MPKKKKRFTNHFKGVGGGQPKRKVGNDIYYPTNSHPISQPDLAVRGHLPL